MGEKTDPAMPIRIDKCAVSLALSPRIGGSIRRFTVQGVDILRPAPEGIYDVVDAASFPLVPIVNRIPNGRFHFEGVDVALDGNFMGLADFVHGHGWRCAWDIVERHGDEVALGFAYPGGAWPWPYRSEQRFTLLENGLGMQLSVQNTGDKRMPTALGFHPFFPTTPQTRLHADYEGHWLNNDWGHPIKRVAGSYRKDFTQGADLIDSVMTDQTHYGFSGHAVLREPGRPTVAIAASPACDHLHVFFPPHGQFVAIEPTTGRGDPFGQTPRQIRILEPGEEFTIWMQIVADFPAQAHGERC